MGSIWIVILMFGSIFLTFALAVALACIFAAREMKEESLKRMYPEERLAKRRLSLPTWLKDKRGKNV